MFLAINGGKPVRTKNFPAYKIIGDEEKNAVNEVLDSGILSRYLGCWHEDFFGGPQVQALEKEWADFYGVKHAIAVNSCTSGLYCAVGATGVEPGEEIIVSPYTMSASAVAPLVYNAIPVFADIEEEYFCLDPSSIEERISSKTRAIIVVDIFGLPYDVERINAIAKKHGIIVIEDCAQAPYSKYKNQFAGSLGDIGVFSLNYHKHIHCGEGGIITTNNDELADKCRLIRNHAEAVVEDKGNTNLVNMIGFNYRMTESEAAIARCQLKKLPELMKGRIRNCEYLNEKLQDIPAVEPVLVRKDCSHSYYVHPFKFKDVESNLKRNRFIDAVRIELPATRLREGEGPLISYGYAKPLYLQPLFQNKIAYGSKGFPFISPWFRKEISYDKGICPVTERMHEKEFFSHEMMRPPMTEADLDDVAEAFWKVWKYRDEL